MIVVEREMVVRVVEVGDVTDASISNTDLLIARYGMSHSHNMSLHERVCLVYCTFCPYSCSYFITYFHSCISCFICPYLFFIILVSSGSMLISVSMPEIVSANTRAVVKPTVLWQLDMSSRFEGRKHSGNRGRIPLSFTGVCTLSY